MSDRIVHREEQGPVLKAKALHPWRYVGEVGEEAVRTTASWTQNIRNIKDQKLKGIDTRGKNCIISPSYSEVP